MDPQQRAADEQLRTALAAFERSVLPAPHPPAPALPAFVGLLRALAGLTRFAIAVALERDDPRHLQPRVLLPS